ncbi:SDR family oxidoreductase [Leifsonia sp. F6_8S_P_1B]|uniref:SDR family oxidoreductase n=1 Tax=Leifsonia williamsii TaxID=3035919 RepID=A0ABT8K9B5_9MICO|nr:SDR family oxidoreductase [Leifsonia williamsii]MDN4614051.1 SDR family oxidoreductase [Leifsonia williamsii]
MKIVVIGGTGLIGSKVVAKLNAHGHEAVAASPNSGVNTLTGEGVDAALAGADVVVDVSNSPSFEDKAVMDFFTTATNTLIAAERKAGVKHHVALSVVGTERMTDSGYMRAKVAQETLITESGIPFTIVHATQFYEFVKSIADAATDGDTVRLAPVFIKPMAAEDVSTAVARAAAGEPVNGVHEVSGPEEFRLTELITRGLAARGDSRTVVDDPDARYFGAHLTDRELVPAPDAEVFPTTFEQWLSAQQAAPTGR